jgi:hypothetical protein
MKMKTRYTWKSLEKDIEKLNKQLEERGNKYRLVVGYRYNYTAIDLATPEQLARHCISRTLECGTPRECLNACYRFLSEGVHS